MKREICVLVKELGNGSWTYYNFETKSNGILHENNLDKTIDVGWFFMLLKFKRRLRGRDIDGTGIVKHCGEIGMNTEELLRSRMDVLASMR